MGKLKRDYFNSIKVRKPFEVLDIFVYSFLLLIVFVLFLCFIILPQAKNAEGFFICLEEKQVCSFNYSTNEFMVFEEFSGKVDFDKENSTITIFLNNDKTKFNKVAFNKDKKVVKMIESTCSISKDCVFEPEISKTGIIFCAPHNLKILPINGDFSPSPPIIGGGA